MHFRSLWSPVVFVAAVFAAVVVAVPDGSPRGGTAADPSNMPSPQRTRRLPASPTATKLSTAFAEAEAPIRPGLLYQKAVSRLQLGRSRQETVFLTLRPRVETSQAFANAKILRPQPLGGFLAETGLRAQAPTAGARPVVSRLHIEDLFRRDAGEETSPADMQVSAGTNYVLQIDNARLSAWDKTSHTGPLASWSLSGTVFSGLLDGAVAGDPWIVYEPSSRRWFISAMIRNPETGGEYIAFAVSAADDPFGTWRFQNLIFRGSANILRDQPKITATATRLVVTWNEFIPPDLTHLVGGNWQVFDIDSFFASKDDIVAEPQYSSGSACFPDPIPARDLSGGDNIIILSTQRPAATTECSETAATPPPFKGNQVTALFVHGRPPAVTVTKRVWQVAVYSAPADPPERSADEKIYAGDTRILSAVFRRGRLILASNDSCVAAVSCFRVIDLDTSSASVRPDEDYDVALAQRYLLYPSLTMDQNGNLVGIASSLSFDGYLGASVFHRLAGHEHTDDWSVSELSRGGVAISCPHRDAEDGWPPDLTRVGDYAGADVDPMSGTTVWVGTVIAPDTPSGNPPYSWSACPQSSVIARLRVY